MHGRASFGIAVSLTVVALTGCGGGNSAPGSAWAPALPPAGAPVSAASRFTTTDQVASKKTFSVSGTYDGSVSWHGRSESYTASLTLTLTQDGSKVSGSFDITRKGKTVDGSLDGTVKVEGKKKAALAFTVNVEGESGTGTATVSGKKIAGKASGQSETISFSAKRVKK
jgi:hypothetical protein